jgi:hypothetical protein
LITPILESRQRARSLTKNRTPGLGRIETEGLRSDVALSLPQNEGRNVKVAQI